MRSKSVMCEGGLEGTALSHLSERPGLAEPAGHPRDDPRTVDGGGTAWSAPWAPHSGALFDNQQAATLVQVSAVTVFAGALAFCAYFGGLRPSGSWMDGLMETKPAELLKYWWWPGLAFASTYYLVSAGVVIFLLRQPGVPTSYAIGGGGLVAGMMALYGYYFGHRRQVEERQGVSLSPSLLRCPFVMGILEQDRPESAVAGRFKGVDKHESTYRFSLNGFSSCSVGLRPSGVRIGHLDASCAMQKMPAICTTKYRDSPRTGRAVADGHGVFTDRLVRQPSARLVCHTAAHLLRRIRAGVAAVLRPARISRDC